MTHAELKPMIGKVIRIPGGVAMLATVLQRTATAVLVNGKIKTFHHDDIRPPKENSIKLFNDRYQENDRKRLAKI